MAEAPKGASNFGATAPPGSGSLQHGFQELADEFLFGPRQAADGFELLFDPGFRSGFPPLAAIILADELGDRHVEDRRAAVHEVKGRVARLALVVREVDPGGAEFFGELLL